MLNDFCIQIKKKKIIIIMKICTYQILTFDKKLGPFIPFYDFGYTLYTTC